MKFFFFHSSITTEERRNVITFSLPLLCRKWKEKRTNWLFFALLPTSILSNKKEKNIEKRTQTLPFSPLPKFEKTVKKDQKTLISSCLSSKPIQTIINKIRTFAPVPGAESKLPSGKVKITSAILLNETPDGEPGTVSAMSAKGAGLLIINTIDAKIKIERLIPEGKKEMSAGDFIRGRRIAQTDRFE